MRHVLSRLVVASLGAGLVLLTQSPALAQSLGRSNQSWRNRAQSEDSQFRRFTFEARFGAYSPEVDEEGALNGNTPFANYFGTAPQFYFGIELDWTPIRIPYVGKLGPGFGWGFVTMNGTAKLASTTTDSGDSEDLTGPSNNFTIHAMHTSAVLRIDEISRRTVVPIVPYAKLGFGFASWSTGTSTGTSCVGDKPPTCGSGTKGEGLSIGPHIALGGMLGLNWLDPSSGAKSRDSYGIHQVFLFGEWMWANLDSGVGKPGMHVGTSTWVLGLAFDL